jgi:hypothetical protein
MSDEYDHDLSRAATAEADRLAEIERRQVRKAIVERRDRSTTPERPVEVSTVERPEVVVPTMEAGRDGGEPA